MAVNKSNKPMARTGDEENLLGAPSRDVQRSGDVNAKKKKTCMLWVIVGVSLALVTGVTLILAFTVCRSKRGKGSDTDTVEDGGGDANARMSDEVIDLNPLVNPRTNLSTFSGQAQRKLEGGVQLPAPWDSARDKSCTIPTPKELDEIALKRYQQGDEHNPFTDHDLGFLPHGLEERFGSTKEWEKSFKGQPLPEMELRSHFGPKNRIPMKGWVLLVYRRSFEGRDESFAVKFACVTGKEQGAPRFEVPRKGVVAWRQKKEVGSPAELIERQNKLGLENHGNTCYQNSALQMLLTAYLSYNANDIGVSEPVELPRQKKLSPRKGEKMQPGQDKARAIGAFYNLLTQSRAIQNDANPDDNKFKAGTAKGKNKTAELDRRLVELSEVLKEQPHCNFFNGEQEDPHEFLETCVFPAMYEFDNAKSARGDHDISVAQRKTNSAFVDKYFAFKKIEGKMIKCPNYHNPEDESDVMLGFRFDKRGVDADVKRLNGSSGLTERFRFLEANYKVDKKTKMFANGQLLRLDRDFHDSNTQFENEGQFNITMAELREYHCVAPDGSPVPEVMAGDNLSKEDHMNNAYHHTPNDVTQLPPSPFRRGQAVKGFLKKDGQLDVLYQIPWAKTIVRFGDGFDNSTGPAFLMLPLSLERFSEGNPTKITNDVEYPLKLDTTTVMQAKDDYFLVSIVKHIGDEPTTGHYVNYSFRDGKWWLFNDENVSEVGVSDLPKDGVKTLLYARQDVFLKGLPVKPVPVDFFKRSGTPTYTDSMGHTTDITDTS